MLTLPAEHHALLLAVHSWAHEPLRRLRDIVDVAAMLEGADRAEIARLARAWGVPKLWRTTVTTVDVLFDGRPSSWALRLWAQNLAGMRERTVLENHLARWLSDFWALPARPALRKVPQTFLDEVRPGGEEDWSAKLSRASVAMRNAARTRSHHEAELIRGRSAPKD
jgi:hypothetical protein